MKNLFDIQGQVVVITGGTGVLGREIGEYLALQGAKVVLMGRNEETGKQIVGGIRGKGGEAMFLRTDVMNPAVVEQNLQDVLSAYGRVDALRPEVTCREPPLHRPARSSTSRWKSSNGC